MRHRTMNIYELNPTDNRKSFYGKCYVEEESDGTKTLYSYNTPILKQLKNGELVRLYDSWTLTTGRHIKAFCGLNKQQYLALELEKKTEN